MIWLQIVLDGGPTYQETRMAMASGTGWVVEPWNALSSLAIVLPGIYWLRYTMYRWRHYPVLFICSVLLLLNGVGSTLFHALRSSVWLLWLDVLPALLMNLIIVLYFSWLWLRSLWRVLLVVALFFLFVWLSAVFLAGSWYVNTQYLIRGIFIFTPTLGLLWRTRWLAWQDLAWAALFLLFSLIFRILDKVEIMWLPMGTHFLWHVLSAVSAIFLGRYLLELEGWRRANSLLQS